MAKMCRPNFRVKLNLSNFYNDVRCFCWIFIDGTKMIQISHIQEHIKELFNIREPFHLLSESTVYLPPNEDIRILKENETILVSPGSGLETDLDAPAIIAAQSDLTCSSMKLDESKTFVEDKQLQTNLPPIPQVPVQEQISKEKVGQYQNGSLDTSTIPRKRQDSVESIAESKPIDTNLTDDLDMTENFLQCPKKKRVRRRKKKPQFEPQITQEEENKLKKPKILNSCIIAAGKHIRFDNLNSEETAVEQAIRPEGVNGSTANNMSPSHELANLLSLGQSSTPLTFVKPKIKEELKKEYVSEDEFRSDVAPKNTSENAPINKKFEEEKNLLNRDFQTCPIMTTKPQLKDVIAFKMLKIGSDYTPQVSDFIVAEVISCCPKTLVYTFKVFQGISEVQVPVGKFTIIEAEEEIVMNDTVTLHYAQIMEPRLLSTSDPDGAHTPSSCTNGV